MSSSRCNGGGNGGGEAVAVVAVVAAREFAVWQVRCPAHASARAAAAFLRSRDGFEILSRIQREKRDGRETGLPFCDFLLLEAAASAAAAGSDLLPLGASQAAFSLCCTLYLNPPGQEGGTAAWPVTPWAGLLQSLAVAGGNCWAWWCNWRRKWRRWVYSCCCRKLLSS